MFSYSCWILFGLVNKAGYFPGLLHKFSLPISLRRILEDLYHHASFPLFTLPCPIYSISARLFRANILRFKKRLRSIQTLSLTSLEYKKILDNTTFEIFLTNDSKCTVKDFGFLGRSGFPCRPHVLDILKTWAQKMLRNFQQNKSN